LKHTAETLLFLTVSVYNFISLSCVKTQWDVLYQNSPNVFGFNTYMYMAPKIYG